MKKTVALIAVAFVLSFLLVACMPPDDKVIRSLGQYKSYEFYTEGEFQDYTDYAKYYFDAVDFADNKYFKKIEQFDINNLNEFLNDFEMWIEHYSECDEPHEIVENYDFDRALIDEEDYAYIYFKRYGGDDRDEEKFYNYDVYFFDIQTNTLYFFHNNI